MPKPPVVSWTKKLIPYVTFDQGLRNTCKENLGDCKFSSTDATEQAEVTKWTTYYEESVRSNQWIGPRNFVLSLFCYSPSLDEARQAYKDAHKGHEETVHSAAQISDTDGGASGSKRLTERTASLRDLGAKNVLGSAVSKLPFFGRQWHMAILQSVPLHARLINLVTGGYCNGGYLIPMMPEKGSSGGKAED